MGAVQLAPSKDTLWTRSPQPATYSDTKQGGDYTSPPHVALDAVLATLSLGPVGISDGLGQVDADLITQAFVGPTNSTLLRPDRPLSWVDGVLVNRTRRAAAGDVRGTHATLPTARGGGAAPGATSHYLVAWRTTADATLARSDLYPSPAATVPLALRRHVLAPAGDAQRAGCVDGTPAVPGCVTLVPAGAGFVVPATGGGASNFSLWAAYEPLANGAYFLGDLTKFVHAPRQRFAYVLVDAASGGPAGLVVGVRGAPGQQVVLAAVDAGGVTRLATAALPASGAADVAV